LCAKNLSYGPFDKKVILGKKTRDFMSIGKNTYKIFYFKSFSSSKFTFEFLQLRRTILKFFGTNPIFAKSGSKDKKLFLKNIYVSFARPKIHDLLSLY
jgi:hypothetical protein